MYIHAGVRPRPQNSDDSGSADADALPRAHTHIHALTLLELLVLLHATAQRLTHARWRGGNDVVNVCSPLSTLIYADMSKIEYKRHHRRLSLLTVPAEEQLLFAVLGLGTPSVRGQFSGLPAPGRCRNTSSHIDHVNGRRDREEILVQKKKEQGW